MNRIFKQHVIKSEKGSALLIALLLMGFLVVFGLGISQLIVNSIRVERNVVEAGKAYFAAEGAVEEGLYWQENRLPGFEVSDDDSHLDYLNGASADYSMTAVGDQVPCEHENGAVVDDKGNFWRPLQVQESVTFPLYRYDEDGGRVDLKDFVLEYFVDREEATNPMVYGNVLRWKILGLDRDKGYTQAISGILEYDQAELEGINILNSQEGEAVYHQGKSGATFVNHTNYPIKQFLEEHTFNYLVLTNVTVLADQEVGNDTAELNVLKVRLTGGTTMEPESSPCEYALIEADGMSGETFQSMDVQIKLDSFLPVFDFVLYETKVGEE